MIHERASLLRHGVMSCDLNTASVMLPITACAGCPCRFKDGSIVEAVVWKGKGAQRHRVVEQVKSACPFDHSKKKHTPLPLSIGACPFTRQRLPLNFTIGILLVFSCRSCRNL